MADIFNMADTWNNAGATFAAIKMNVIDTASAAASLLMDLQVGGASCFKVSKVGNVDIGGAGFATYLSLNYGSGVPTIRANGTMMMGFHVSQGPNLLTLAFSRGAVQNGPDTYLQSDEADTLAQRRSTNAQKTRVYGTYTDVSNYRRLALGMTSAGVASLTPEGAGTGAAGNVLHISGLPTSNPGSGILWNDAGTVKVGT